MNATMNYVLYIFTPGSGIVFSKAGIDLIIFSLIILILHHYVLIFYKAWKETKHQDRIAGFHLSSSKYKKLHWLKGHSAFYTSTEEGLLKAVERTTEFPGLFNFHVASYFSFLTLHHADTVKPLLASTAIKEKNIYGFWEPWIGEGLLTSNGKLWQRHRRLLTPAFHFGILKSYIGIFNECSKVMLDKWQDVMKQPIEVFEDIGLLTLDTMMRCTMSSTTDCQKIKGHPYIKSIHALSKISVKRLDQPLYLIDWLFWLLPIGRRYRKEIEFVHSYTAKIISDRRKQLTQTVGSIQTIATEENDEVFSKQRKVLDFIDVLLQSKDEDGSGLSDKEIRDEVDTFLFEGHDTTSSGISWALYNLAKYPKFQEKCRNEIHDVIGLKPNVEWEDLHKLSYLTMFIKESLRLYPPVWLIARELTEDLSISSKYNKSGRDIPKGTRMVVHFFSLHRNPHLWENPNDFIPERFSKLNVTKLSSHAYLPFSAGSRNCIGQNFAMNEIKVVLAQTLRRFLLSLPEDEPPPVMAPMIVLKAKDGIKINFSVL
ncbi:leukotriene-B4 omega-hydroxylase 3-like [Clavelina lepadiformis]|uniref:leukotriene-B4 omega-hydroxylase 3-like n=1 Tax=Clavelina lepadiformis TaxID=159417 RepID=UPI004041478B